jgi:hypothetical protein
MKQSPLRLVSRWPLFGRLIVLGTCLIGSVFVRAAILDAATTGGTVTLFSPIRSGGALGNNDERDIDTYPATAYDPATGRYLVVWMSPRNAGSSSDGLDVYGVFLNQTGKPIGSEFRISDSNSAARNGKPAVAAGNGSFAVAWTVRGEHCGIVAQLVTNSSGRYDRVLISGDTHRHSPNIIYNPTRHQYVLAFVDGDDYLPPTFYGAQTADCGNNASSTSAIKALEFYFSGEVPIVGNVLTVSSTSSGSFRPRLGYSAVANQYQVVWEDRRNAGGQAYRIDVFTQRVNANLTLSGSNVALETGTDYTNFDTTATWTPRPAVTGGQAQFLATWFSRASQGNGVTWSVKGRLVPISGTPGDAFTIASIPFAEQHMGNSPAGFLDVTYNPSTQEYMVGMTSYQESLWGYLSSALTQRVSPTGQLLNLAGTVMNQPGVGFAVDYAIEDQISLSMAMSPVAGPSSAGGMIVYSKHSPGKPSQDSDIWGVSIQLPAPNLKNIHLPVVFKR